MRSIIQDGRRLSAFVAAIFLLTIAAGMLLFGNHAKQADAQVSYTIGQPSLTVTASQTSFACNWAVGPVCRVQINGTVGATPTFQNMVDGGHYTWEIQQDATGHTVPLPLGMVAQGGGTGPTLSSSANSLEFIQFDFVASPIATATAEMIITGTSSNLVLPAVNNNCQASAVMSAGVATVTGACFAGAVAANCWVQGAVTPTAGAGNNISDTVSAGTVTILAATANASPIVACARVK